MKHFSRVIALVFLAILMSACGGGGGDGDPGGPSGHSVASLQGSWYGTMRDTGGTLHTVQIFIDGAGNITSILQDGIGQGVTGVITKVSAKVFGLLLSDGTDAGFIVDGAGTHAGYLDDGFYFGALQKGASSIPTYASGDVVGSWSGYGVTVDGAFELDQEFSSSATVDGGFQISGSDGLFGNFTGEFQSIISAWGVYQGIYDNGIDTGTVVAFLSADKSFAASYACKNGGTFPTGCSYTAWNK